MKIHFSILAVILGCALIWERPIKHHKLKCIYYGERYDYKSLLMPWLIVFGYIAFLAAMRSGMNDTGAYVQSFHNIPGTWESVAKIIDGDGKDKAFDVTANIFKMYISSDYHWWFAFFAIIESGIFIYVLRRESVSFLDSCYVFFATTLYYNYFSMTRQWFAVLLLFAGSRLIKERKTIPYIILCIVAAQFHSSAYLFIPVYFIVTGEAWSKKQNILILASVLALFFLDPILNAMQTSLEGTTYDYALDAMASGSGSSIIRPIIAAVPVAIAFLYRSRIDRSNKMINVCINMSLINLLLNLLAAFTSGLYVIRLATYTAVYNLILYPYILNVAVSGNDRKIVKTCFYIIYFLFYCYQMSHQGAWGYSSDILGTFS